MRKGWIILCSIVVHFGWAQSLLWKIQCSDCPGESFLLGTIHLQDPRVLQAVEPFLPNIEQCDFFVSEIAMDSMDSMHQLNFFSMMMLPNGKTLKDYYSRKQYKALEKKFYQKTKMKLSLFSRMKPFFIQSMLLSKELKASKNEKTTSGQAQKRDLLDLYLYQYAKQHHKKNLGLESIQSQLQVFDSFPIEDQAKALYEVVVKEKKIDKSLLNAMIDRYVEGDLNSLLKLIQENEYDPRFMKRLIEDRNQNMADRIAEWAKRNRLFIAIGAGHLPGSQGVIQLLQNKGFQVTPVK